MKKIMTIAAMLAAVMVSFSSCKKDDTKPQGGGNTVTTCPDCGEALEDCTCNDFQAAIQIDGEFADWAAVTPAVATCNPDAKYTALTTLKAYMDEVYGFLYVEFDEDEIVDRAWTPFHVYMNADNSDATGGFGDQWTDANAEFMFETAIFGSDAFTTWDAALFKWWGAVGESGWLWTEGSVAGFEHSSDDNWGALLGEGSGITMGAGNGNAFEISILKEMVLGAEFAETISVGVDIQQSWSSVGILPNAAVTDDNTNGLAPKLVVNLAK